MDLEAIRIAENPNLAFGKDGAPGEGEEAIRENGAPRGRSNT